MRGLPVPLHGTPADHQSNPLDVRNVSETVLFPERYAGAAAGINWDKQAGGVLSRWRITAYVLSLLQEAIPEGQFELFLFDSNPNIWGSVVAGLVVMDPAQLEDVRPDLVIVSNYNYSQEIFNQLKPLWNVGIRVEKLHKDTDVPWVF